jgi:hypothetical protein
MIISAKNNNAVDFFSDLSNVPTQQRPGFDGSSLKQPNRGQ